MQTSVIILYNNTSPHENTYVHETTIAVLCTFIISYITTEHLLWQKTQFFQQTEEGINTNTWNKERKEHSEMA